MMDALAAVVTIFMVAASMLILVLVFMIVAAYRVWKRMQEQRRMWNRLLHLEYFSLMWGKMILPEGDDPTYESERKRFDAWRMN